MRSGFSTLFGLSSFRDPQYPIRNLECCYAIFFGQYGRKGPSVTIGISAWGGSALGMIRESGVDT